MKLSEYWDKFVYFRDRAKELGLHNAYELPDPNKPHGYDNQYAVGDRDVWLYIAANKKREVRLALK